MSRRVVITGMGAVTCLGNSVDITWENIKKSKSGICKITRFDTSEMPDSISKIAGEVNLNEEDENSFDPSIYRKKRLKKNG